jgi:hypothetical protein
MTEQEMPTAPASTAKSPYRGRGFWIWTVVFTVVGGFVGWMANRHGTTSPLLGGILGAMLCLFIMLVSPLFPNAKGRGCGT